MAWPDNLKEIVCTGFPREWLPSIADAIDRDRVRWVKSDLFLDLGIAQFEWVGCTWELSEMRECIRSVSLIKGAPTAEDLTHAVLKG